MRRRYLALVFFFASGPHVGPQVRPDGDPATALSFMTFNVQFDARSWTASLDAIENERPDVACLQEVTPDFEAQFEKRLAASYPYRSFEPAPGTWGLALASRFPLSEVDSFQQTPSRMPGVEGNVTIGNRAFRVVCVHLFPPLARRDNSAGLLRTIRSNARLRAEQGSAIAARTARLTTPVVVLGDFNESGNGGASAPLQAIGFMEACPSCGNTWRGAAWWTPAFAAIDHVFSRGMNRRGGRVVHAGSSDHVPLLVWLSLPPL